MFMYTYMYKLPLGQKSLSKKLLLIFSTKYFFKPFSIIYT